MLQNKSDSPITLGQLADILGTPQPWIVEQLLRQKITIENDATTIIYDEMINVLSSQFNVDIAAKIKNASVNGTSSAEILDSIIAKEKESKSGTLDLSYLKLLSIPAMVNTMPWLKTLILKYNEIRDIENIDKLTKLKKLDLYNNQIADLTKLPLKMPLEFLGLSNNRITSLKGIGHLSSLKELYLASNGLSDINEIAHLTNLQRLVLSNNRIASLKPLLHLVNIGLKVSIEYSFDDTEAGIFIPQNSTESPPLEIIKQGNAAIINYFKQIEASAKVYNNKFFKIILVGNSEAGKSEFIKNFVNSNKNNTTSTHYLEIENWSGADIKKTLGQEVQVDDDATAFVYDLGGQEYYHDTHKLYFTTKTIYLLFWENRTNKLVELDSSREQSSEKIQHYPLEYWLESISFMLNQGLINSDHLKNNPNPSMEDYAVELQKLVKKRSNTPVLIIENKIDLNSDQSSTKLNQLNYAVHQLNIYDFVSLSFLNKNRIAQFKQGLADVINILNPKADILPPFYEAIIQAIFDIQKMQKEVFLSKNQLKKIIEKNIPDASSRNELTVESVLDYLSQKGIIIYLSTYFDDTKDENLITNKIVVNPDLFRKHIYDLFEKVKKSAGKFSSGILADAALERNIMAYLQHFKLIFNIANNDYVAPLYLPPKPEAIVEMFLDQLPIPARRFQFDGYIHKTIIMDIFAHLKNKEALFHYVWRNGLIISKKDLHLQKIYIKFNSEQIGEYKANCYIDIYQLQSNGSSDFLDEVIQIINDLLIGLRTSELVSVNGKDYISLSYLNTKAEEGEVDVFYENKRFKVAQFNPFLKNKLAFKNVFISYAKEDVTYLDTIETTLSTLKRQGLINTWTDRRILAGADWNDEIQKKLEEADVILCLITPNYFKEDKRYIWDIEIPHICKAMQNNSKHVIPIHIVNTYDWNKVPLGNDATGSSLRFGDKNWLPNKSFVKSEEFTNESDAWAAVAKGIAQVIKPPK